MNKPFYVTLTYSGVVMAEDERDAYWVAEAEARDIVSDSLDPDVECIIEVTSLAHLRRLDSGWDGECCAYGGENPRLKDVLPEEDPPKPDTSTIDMFAGPV